jgi:hypothetical protein
MSDLKTAHGNETVMKIEQFGKMEFATEPHDPASEGSPGWRREPNQTGDVYCRQLAKITVENSAGNLTCHIEAALYKHGGSTWRFQSAVRGVEGCSE